MCFARKSRYKIQKIQYRNRETNLEVAIFYTTLRQRQSDHLIGLPDSHQKKKRSSLWWDNLILYVGKIRVTWATKLPFLINMQIYLVRRFKHLIRFQPLYRSFDVTGEIMYSCTLLEFNQLNESTDVLHTLYCANICGNTPLKSNMVVYINRGTCFT